MAMNKVAGENLYIGGTLALYERKALKEAGITHVVSVLQLSLEKKLFQNYDHKIIEVDDFDDENLLKHFTHTNEFISGALQAGCSVLIHCAMGKSRSATILAAYLMASRRITPSLALRIIERTRPIVEPNPGFMRQLGLYYEMEYSTNVEDHAIYQQWMCLKAKMGNSAGKTPEYARFRDAEAKIRAITQKNERGTSTEVGETELRCKKCWETLATSTSLTPHFPKPTQPPTPRAPQQRCSHYFMEPLPWMEAELSRGEVSGSFECTGCKSRVGTYAWQGLRCPCGAWVVPGLSMTREKVDEIKVKP